MNDTWCWACAMGEYVPDKSLPEVAELFWRYGNAGLLYWVSERNNGMRSEFHDVNRMASFVRHEEKLRKKVPSSSARAYKRIKYTLGKSTLSEMSDRYFRQLKLLLQGDSHD